MRLPQTPARTRKSPQRRGRKALLTAEIPAYPRSARKRHDRPVTPEVAGSSPVAPVTIPANRHVVLSVQTPNRRRLHRLFSRREPKRAKCCHVLRMGEATAPPGTDLTGLDLVRVNEGLQSSPARSSASFLRRRQLDASYKDVDTELHVDLGTLGRRQWGRRLTDTRVL
jgi:hypothetical protein